MGGEVVGLRTERGKELLEIHVPDVDVFYDCLVCGHPCAFCQRLLSSESNQLSSPQKERKRIKECALVNKFLKRIKVGALINTFLKSIKGGALINTFLKRIKEGALVKPFVKRINEAH